MTSYSMWGVLRSMESKWLSVTTARRQHACSFIECSIFKWPHLPRTIWPNDAISWELQVGRWCDAAYRRRRWMLAKKARDNVKCLDEIYVSITICKSTWIGGLKEMFGRSSVRVTRKKLWNPVANCPINVFSRDAPNRAILITFMEKASVSKQFQMHPEPTSP